MVYGMLQPANNDNPANEHHWFVISRWWSWLTIFLYCVYEMYYINILFTPIRRLVFNCLALLW